MIKAVCLKFIMLSWERINSEHKVAYDGRIRIEWSIKKRFSEVIMVWDFLLKTAYRSWQGPFLVSIMLLLFDWVFTLKNVEIKPAGVFLFDLGYLSARVLTRFTVYSLIVPISLLEYLEPLRISLANWFCQISENFLVVKLIQFYLFWLKVFNNPREYIILGNAFKRSIC